MHFIRKLLLLLFILVPANFLCARDVRIFVHDMDLDLPLEGAIVRSWDGSDHFCDEEGKTAISVPDDRQVTVQVSYPGYETGRLVIPVSTDELSLGLRPGSAIESRDLVIEAQRPGISETRSGRSVAISGENMERSSQIGLIEDVMTSIKLFPGVGYTGMFSALPSIRGGDPGDLMAVLDGFYIENPYHWGGGFSIFDPHMVRSAQLSHGIFSGRYGHTISGLLEVSSRMASPDYAELEIGISTSAVNINAAFPLGKGGGLMIMGKVTYWDPFVWMLKQLSTVVDNERLDMVNAVTTAPYIRSAAASFGYRFNADLGLSATAFVGADGVGADYHNETINSAVSYSSRMIFKWDNLKSFFIAGLDYNPRPSMLLKLSAGIGYDKSKADGGFEYDYLEVNNPPLQYTLGPEHLNMHFLATESVTNIQGRFDFDWSLGKGFLAAAGIQELYSQNISEQEGKFFMEVKSTVPFPPFPPPYDQLSGQYYYMHYPVVGKLPEVKNRRFNSSAYVLGEYSSPGNRFGAELGLRMDHLYFKGKDFDLMTLPVFNPRLNLDFNVFRKDGFVKSLDLTLGSGLFSSINEAITFLSINNEMDDFELRPNRSWTSIFGVKTDFSGGWSFNIEGYFKYVFDRAYQYSFTVPGEVLSSIVQRFNGNGLVWGFDFMLQKFESRYWDGWLSYTFTHARYHEPESPARDYDPGDPMKTEDLGWYYPWFHRFHNLNLVLNFKPSRNFNIYLRLGLASGRPKSVAGKITGYPVVLFDENGDPVPSDPANPLSMPLIITKYKRETSYSDKSRTSWSVPMDLKLSYTIFNPARKVQTEMYLAVENLLSLVYVAKANTKFNTYTGEEDRGSDSANYEMPVPMASVGIKWSY